MNQLILESTEKFRTIKSVMKQVIKVESKLGIQFNKLLNEQKSYNDEMQKYINEFIKKNVLQQDKDLTLIKGIINAISNSSFKRDSSQNLGNIVKEL